MITIALIPGAGGDAFYWRWVVPLLEARGHRVVAVDLPAGDEAAGVEEYADVVLAAVGESDRLVLVAQSLGGYTAAAVAERVPVELIVYVAAMIPGDDTAGDWWEVTGQPMARRACDIQEGRDPDAPFDEAVTFLHDIPAEVLSEVLAAGASPQTGTPFDTPNTWSDWRSVPSRAIAATCDRMFPLEFMRAQVHDRLGIEADKIDSGHLPAFSRAGELATLISGYIDELNPEISPAG